MNYFSRNIRFLRNKSGLRQAEMLEKIGIARTTWSSYENGVSQPDIDGILRIARFFGIAAGDLLQSDLSNSDGGTKVPAFEGIPLEKRQPDDIAGEPLSVTGQLLFDVVTSKQQVIDMQAQTIRALQALIEHLTRGEKEAADLEGEKKTAGGEGKHSLSRDGRS
jgi:transcriptional regulator with XRE-family HTH domain